MPYGYTGGYIQPWQSVGMGLRNIGKLLGDQQRRDELLRQAEMRERAEALARSGAMTFEDAVGKYEFENIGDIANASVNVAPQFARPEAIDIPLPGTGGDRGIGGVGPPRPDKTVRYQPETPIIGPSGIVQTDPGPHAAIGKLMLERQIQEALAGPAEEKAPVRFSEDYFEGLQRELDMRARSDEAKAKKKEAPFRTHTQARDWFRSEYGVKGRWEPGRNEPEVVPGTEHVWTYRDPVSGTDIPASVIENLIDLSMERGEYVRPSQYTGYDVPTGGYRTTPDPLAVGGPEGRDLDLSQGGPTSEELAARQTALPMRAPMGVPADTTLPMAAPMDTTGLPGPLPAPSPAMRPESAAAPSSSPFRVGSEAGPANYGPGGGPPAGMGGGPAVAGYGKPQITKAEAHKYFQQKVAGGMDPQEADQWILANYTVSGF